MWSSYNRGSTSVCLWYILENKCMDNEKIKRFDPEKDRERFPDRVMLEVIQERRMRENEGKGRRGIPSPGKQAHRPCSRREPSESEGPSGGPWIQRGKNLGKLGEARLAGSQGPDPQTFPGHVKFCLHPKSNEKKLEDFEKVSISIRPEMWKDHSGCSGIKRSPLLALYWRPCSGEPLGENNYQSWIL